MRLCQSWRLRKMAAKVPAAGVDLDGAITINESSADVDFRIESDGNTHMLFVDGGNNKVGIGESANAPMGTLHIKSADSGDTAIDVNNDDLVVENDNHAGISICTPNDKAGGLYFSDPDDTASGRIIHDHSTNGMTFQAGNLEFLRTDSSRKLSTGGEDTPDCDAGGLTIDENANDGAILTFKSSDIAHGVTDSAETDTWCKFTKESAANGGLIIQSYTEAAGSEAFKVIGTVGGSSFNTGRSTSGHAVLEFAAAGGDGSTGDADCGSNANLMSIQNRNTARFFFDAEGDFHADSSSTTFDEYDDAQLARTFDITHGRGVIESKFDKFISYNHEKLAELQLVGREEDGAPNHFINVTGMQRLHNGAIWQQYEKHQRLAEAVYEMAKEALGEDKADAILEKHDIKLLN
jgi:hypothetical protein